MKQLLKRIWFFLSGAVLLVAGMLVMQGIRVSAAEVSLVKGDRVEYMGYSTHYYYVDGRLAYCLEPDMLPPGSGSYPSDVLDKNQLISKAMYYVYGGPGFEEYMRPTLTGGWDQTDRSYCLSHCILSYIYDGCDPDSAGFTGLNEDIRNAVIQYTTAIQGWPDIPDTDIRFSEDALKASFSLEEGLQRTQTIQCIGDARNSLSFDLPEGVMLVNESKGTSDSGAVTVHGGEYFYLAADVAYGNGTTWSSGEIYGAIKDSWRSLVIKTGSGSQDIGSGELITVQTQPVNLGAAWIPKPELVVDKTADKTDKKYKVGDVITYTVDVTQRVAEAVAKNLVISDTILTQGVKLQKNSVVLLDQNLNVVSDAVITVKGNTYMIQAGESLSFLQSVESGDKFTIEYQVIITDESVIGREVENEVIVRADNADEVKDREIVEIEEPEEPKPEEPKPEEPKPEEPKPEEPDEPEPEKPQPEEEPLKPAKKASVVKTGDDQNLKVLMILLILSCTAICTCVKIARKTK